MQYSRSECFAGGLGRDDGVGFGIDELIVLGCGILGEKGGGEGCAEVGEG